MRLRWVRSTAIEAARSPAGRTLSAHMSKKELRELLEKNLMLFEPDRYLPKYVSTARDIYEHRALLRELPCSEYTLNHLLGILIRTVEGGQTFRTLDCLRVVRDIIRRAPATWDPGRSTAAKLFCLYRTFVFHHSEDVRWCVSRLVKGRVLQDDWIRWLVAHYRESGHLVDRLLLYPVAHPLITEWAAGVWQRGELRDRESQVMALLICDEIPDCVRGADAASVVWAVYYARVSDETKQRLLMQNLSLETLDAVLDVSNRLGYPAVIKYALAQLCGGADHIARP
jgi:hypothetical protein